MRTYTLYHNPRCSKSRQTLQLLKDNNISPEIVLYLEQVPSVEVIGELVKKLGISARALLRKGESAYKENNLSDGAWSEQALIEAMHKQPKLIERPIVISGDRAVLGRPPENVLGLL
jgi:arsenate reductase